MDFLKLSEPTLKFSQPCWYIGHSGVLSGIVLPNFILNLDARYSYVRHSHFGFSGANKLQNIRCTTWRRIVRCKLQIISVRQTSICRTVQPESRIYLNARQIVMQDCPTFTGRVVNCLGFSSS